MNFEARDFPFKNMFYKMYRARDMGEYVPIYQSEKQKNEQDGGYSRCKWNMQENLMKDLCHND